MTYFKLINSMTIGYLAVVMTTAFFVADAASASPQEIQARDGNVKFPNGEIVPVTLKKYTPAEPNVQYSRKLIEMHGPLVESANSGDLAAARILGQYLRACKGSFNTESDLESAIEKLHNEGIQTYGDGREPKQLSHDGSISNTEKLMRQNFEVCDGVSKTETDTATDWSRIAAENGDYLALQEWTTHLGESDESYNLWHDAWESGYLGAVQELVYYNKHGILKELAGQPDYYMAYVYLTIDYSVQAEAYGGSLDANTAKQMKDAVKGLGALLSPTQQAAAEAEAARLLAGNENCCSVWHLFPK